MIQGYELVRQQRGTDLVVVRYMAENDVEQLREYINRLSSEQTFITLQGEQISLDEEKKYIEESIKKVADKTAIKLVLEVNGRICGTADVTRGQRTHQHVGYVGLSIDASVRGKKLGRLLFESLIAEAQRTLEGLRVLQLSVFQDNVIAQNLYMSVGFVSVAVLPGTIRYKGEYVDEVLMVKKCSD